MTSIINWLLLVMALGCVWMTSRHLVGLLTVVTLMMLDLFGHGMDNSTFLVACEFSLVYIIVNDIKTRGRDSLFLGYNPIYAGNRLRPRLKIFFLIAFLMAFVIRIVAFVVWKR